MVTVTKQEHLLLDARIKMQVERVYTNYLKRKKKKKEKPPDVALVLQK